MKRPYIFSPVIFALLAAPHVVNAQPGSVDTKTLNHRVELNSTTVSNTANFVQATPVTITPGTVTETYLYVSGVTGKPPSLKVDVDYTGIPASSEQANYTQIELIAPSRHNYFLKYAYPFCIVDPYYCGLARWWDFKNSYDEPLWYNSGRLRLNGIWTLRIDSRNVPANSAPWTLNGWILTFPK